MLYSKKLIYTFSIYLLFQQTLNAQFSSEIDTIQAKPNYKALRAILASESVLYAGALYGLSKSWYQNPLTNFTFRDDTPEWLQIDKVGHLYTSYQIARHNEAVFKQTGISKKQVILYSAISGIIFQTPIEILDGFSPEYGFSPGDMTANILGSAIYVVQAALWDEMRIMPKFSFHYTSLAAVRPELLGQSYSERWLKDYNGQTYWLSGSPGTFAPGGVWPKWLCLSLGYGINDMVSAERDISIQMGYLPYRQFYLSLDIDFTKLPTRKKWVRTIAFLLNSLKVPAPALVLCGNKFEMKSLSF